MMIIIDNANANVDANDDEEDDDKDGDTFLAREPLLGCTLPMGSTASSGLTRNLNIVIVNFINVNIDFIHSKINIAHLSHCHHGHFVSSAKHSTGITSTRSLSTNCHIWSSPSQF